MLIIGHGSIGRALETRLLPFGARVAGIARTAREGVHSMLGESQVLLDSCKALQSGLPYTEGIPVMHHC